MNNGFVQVRYNIKSGIATFHTNLNKEGVEEIIEAFLQSQFGKGHDDTPPNHLEEYSITIQWDPSDDSVKCFCCDTGNKGLREGILIQALNQAHNMKEIVPDVGQTKKPKKTAQKSKKINSNPIMNLDID